MDLKNVIVTRDGPIKDDAELHGRDIGYIWASGGVGLTVDYAELHDGWVPIVNPNPWRDSGKQGWVKWSRCTIDDPTAIKVLLTIQGGNVTAKIVE